MGCHRPVDMLKTKLNDSRKYLWAMAARDHLTLTIKSCITQESLQGHTNL